MKKLFCIFIAVALSISAYIFLLTNSIDIEASITTYPFALKRGEELGISHKNISMVATSDTFNDLINGNTDIIFVTMPNTEQQRLLTDSEGEFELIPISTESIVVLINKDNPIMNISSRDLNKIYMSNLNWSNFGWEDNPINSYQISVNNGSATIFNKIMSGNIIDDHHIETPYMDVLIDLLGNDKYGIGYAFYTFSNEMYRNENLKIINIDNKSYNDENYILKSNIFVGYNKNNDNPLVHKFINKIINEKKV